MTTKPKNQITEERESTLMSSLIVFALCVMTILVGVIIMGLAVQIPLVCAIAVVTLYGVFILHIPYQEMENSMIRSLGDSLGVMLLLLTIGPLIAAWVSCGTVPYVIYLGLGLISPAWFLPFVAIMCAILSTVTGSSWTTVGTIGVAFIGISIGLGISLPLTAGAILCGAYFGDKISPLSDMVVFNSGITGVPLLDHAKRLMYTTAPAFVVSIIIYFILGLRYRGSSLDTSSIDEIQNGLAEVFNFSPIMWLPIIAVAVAIIVKIPAIPALWVGVVTGGIVAVACQGVSFGSFMGYLFDGFSIETGMEQIDKILNRGGMTSMWNIIGVVICSMSMGGVFDRTKMLSQVAGALKVVTKTRVGLIVSTLITGIVSSFVASDPYIAGLIPAKTFADDYDRQGLDRSVLSRTISDGGICYAPLVPWGSNGIFCATTLGMTVSAYFPFYFMGFLTPLFSILTAVTGIGITYAADRSAEDEPKAANE